MTTPQFDPTQYKAAQRQNWDAAAPAWERWADRIDESSRDVSRALIELARIQSSHRVLDIASGTGEPALTVARHVGPAGRVVATDQSSRMLAVARSRAAAQGLQNLEFQEVDAEALDFPEGSFDAALCRFGLMFLPDLAGTLQRVRRFLRPGGWFATAIWDVPPRVPMIGVAMDLTSQMFEVPAPPPGVPSLFSLSPPGVLEQAFTAAGFTNVQAQAAQVGLDFPSGEEFTGFVLDTAAPIAAILERQSAERQGEFRQSLARAAGQYATANGAIHMVNHARCVAGQRSM
jgi:ubiquinone/menaquinone biosynthesis C-methylase UbiE